MKLVKIILGVVIISYLLFELLWFCINSCEVKDSCYLCLNLTTSVRKEFTQKKFKSIKKGMHLNEVNKLLGEPYDVEICNEKEFNFILDYSDWKSNKLTSNYVMFYVFFSKDSLVVDTGISEDN